MNRSNALRKLNQMDACSEGMAWARENGGDLAAMWEACPRADWMAWFVGESKSLMKKGELLLALADCAEYVLKAVGKESPNATLYKKILKEVRRIGNGGKDDGLIWDYRVELRNAVYDSRLEATFRELAEAVDMPRGAYMVPTCAADAFMLGTEDGKRMKALKHMAKYFRKYFHVGQRGLTTVKGVNNG